MGSGVHDIDWRSGCPISSGLDVLGDRWSLLIVRDLIMHETRTYSDFRASPEGVATNILAARLRLLTGLGVIERTDPRGAARNNAYKLTPSGEALRPVLEELGKWSLANLNQLNPDILTPPPESPRPA